MDNDLVYAKYLTSKIFLQVQKGDRTIYPVILDGDENENEGDIEGSKLELLSVQFSETRNTVSRMLD